MDENSCLNRLNPSLSVKNGRCDEKRNGAFFILCEFRWDGPSVTVDGVRYGGMQWRVLGCDVMKQWRHWPSASSAPFQRELSRGW